MDQPETEYLGPITDDGQAPKLSFGVDFSKGRDQSCITVCEMKGHVAVCRPATCEEFAKAYVDLLHTPPNAWGQHCMDGFGQSHSVLHAGSVHFGKKEFDAAVDLELQRRKP